MNLPFHPTTFGESIRHARTARHWTQQRLADALGVRRQSIALWERDKPIGALKLTALRALFGAELMDPTPPPPSAELAYWRGRVEQVARLTAALLDAQREIVADMAGPYVATENDPALRDRALAMQAKASAAQTPLGHASTQKRARHR